MSVMAGRVLARTDVRALGGRLKWPAMTCESGSNCGGAFEVFFQGAGGNVVVPGAPDAEA